MDKNFIEVEQLPLGERVYLKKDSLGYRIVHPVKDEDGKLNWINLLFGGKRNLIYLILVLLLFGLFSYGVYELTYSMRDVVENPCEYCANYTYTLVNTGPNVPGGINAKG